MQTSEDSRVVVAEGQGGYGHDLWNGAEAEDLVVPQPYHVLQGMWGVPAFRHAQRVSRWYSLQMLKLSENEENPRDRHNKK